MRGRRWGTALMAAMLALLAVGGHPPAREQAANEARPARPAALAAIASDVRVPSVPRWPRPVAQRPAAPRIILGAITSGRLVALTFDLDMSPTMVAQLQNRSVTSWINQDALGYLESAGVHATIFMTAMWAEQYPSLARGIAEQPQFEIANHSYSHAAFHRPCYQLAGAGSGGIQWELVHAQQVLQRITRVTPRFFRFPGGCYDRHALDAVHANGLTPVQWSVNSTDAFNRYPGQIAATVLSQVKPGAIVVLHLQGGPNAPATGQALKLIVPELVRRGYQFVTVGELLQAGLPVQPSDPREVVEAYQAPPSPPPTPRPLVVVRPTRPPCWQWSVKLHAWVHC